MKRPPPSRPSASPFTGGLRLAVAAYQALWWLLLPLAFGYLWWMGRREPDYRRHWGERLGRLAQHRLVRPIWVYGSSLGEIKGSSALIARLLDEGEHILLLVQTPDGRRAADQLFPAAVQSGRLQAAYTPAEVGWAHRRLARQTQPKALIVTEYDVWPVMLKTAKDLQLPTAIVNAHYPQKSFERDMRGAQWRARLYRAYDRVLCKSDLHAQRFVAAGCAHVQAAGELRFDALIPPHLLHAAQELLQHPAVRGRPVHAVVCAEAEEDALLAPAVAALAERLRSTGTGRPLCVYVPRNPQNFQSAAAALRAAGLSVVLRSEVLTADLQPTARIDALAAADVLLGDSLGEMYFYLALAQLSTVGGSFVPHGSHNVIESLSLGKRVLVGPSIYGIEYPAREALAAGVLSQCRDANHWVECAAAQWPSAEPRAQDDHNMRAFMATHMGATDQHMAVLRPWLNEAPNVSIEGALNKG